MKRLFFVLGNTEIIAEVWQHEKFGKVVLFRQSSIMIDDHLSVYDAEEHEQIKGNEGKEITDMILASMPLNNQEPA